MIDVDDFIEGFLAHGQSKEDIKRYNREYYLRNRKLKGRSSSNEARILAAEKKIQRARAAASKLPPKKRNAVLKKLIAAQKKLNSLKNPFRSKTKVTSRTVSSKIKDVSRFGSPKPFDGRIKDMNRFGSGKSTNVRRKSRAGSGK